MIDLWSVPPATSAWTVLITAAAAFFGVVLAQWWTTRREDRNWQRQLQMYATQWADQSQRDAEQREDQRRRDHELWEREDRHRFTERKRDTYANLLESGEALIRHVRDSLIRLESQRQDGSEFDLSEWSENGDALKEFTTLSRQIVGSESYVKLIASPEVVVETMTFAHKAYGSMILVTALATLSNEEFEQKRESVQKQAVSDLWIAHEELAWSMRRDLLHPDTSFDWLSHRQES